MSIKYLTIGLFLPLFLLACAPTTPQHGGTTGGHKQDGTPSAKNLIIRDQSTDSDIAFSVRDGNETFSDYGVSHTKEMHLIVVRDDLQHFQHLHPERDAENIWRVPFMTSAGGTYWRYADFVDSDEKTYTIRFDKKYPGDIGGIVKNFEKVMTIDGYRFIFNPAVSGSEVTFTYDITDGQGQLVELEEYLGATGHSVLIAPSGDFIHTHPSNEDATPVFSTALPSDDFYRIFTQFKIRGEILTVSFDWERESR